MAGNEFTGGNGDMERYEALRAQALGTGPVGWSQGLALFQGRGMAAWLRACRELAPVSGCTAAPADGSVQSGWDDLVSVLVAMALAVVG